MRLLKALEQINEEHLISFHMPGHKGGRLLSEHLGLPLEYDLTEIPGADNLHHAQGCILETEVALSKFYGSAQTRILVGGSTAGILAAILGTVNRGEHMILNRNAHQSIYNAMEIGGIHPVYLCPKFDDKLGIVSGLSLDELNQALERASVVVFTYPTYEGICYDIEPLIQMAHKRNKIVIVDEAHGAHLSLFGTNHKSALDLGADMVIQSFHKTLPAMTQTACLHFGQENLLSQAQMESVLWYLGALQTSSPSYVLMSSVDAMLTVMEVEGKKLVKALKDRMTLFYQRMAKLKNLQVQQLINQEITKIIISSDVYNCREIDRHLRTRFHIQVEYATDQMCLLMTSIATRADDLEALENALMSLDLQGPDCYLSERKSYGALYQELIQVENRVMSPWQAKKMPSKVVSLSESLGQISGEYVIPYPPGIPIVVPGECITEAAILLAPKEMERIRIIEVRNG